jgi:hypothetical protein
VRFKNEGTTAKLATATPDDFKKNLRVTAMMFSPYLIGDA